MIDSERLFRCMFHGLLARSDDYPPKDGLYQDYTYFKPAPLDKIRDAWKNTVRLIRDGKAPENIILYIHWPFCPSQCTYCFCSMTVSQNRREWDNYTRSLMREMDAFRDVFKGVELHSVYFGGGTPTYITESQLDALFKHIRSCFKLRRGAEIYFEASPATLTAKKVDLLRRHGVNRITLGLQTRDDAVLRGVNRKGQSKEAVERAWKLLAGCRGIIRDVDLMVGLEGQTRMSFLQDLIWSIRKGADIIHIQSFDPRAQTLFSRKRKRKDADYWRVMAKTVEIAEGVLKTAGYGMTHYDLQRGVGTSEEKILSDDPFELSSVLALGKHGKAHAFGSAWYQHPPVRAGGFRSDRIPPFQYIPADLDEEMRCYVIRSLCLHERVNLPAFRRLFGRELNEDVEVYRPLLELAQWGKVRLGTSEIRLASRTPLERLIWLKHLYHESVLNDVIAKHRGRFAEFKRAYKRDPENTLRQLRTKAEARTYHLVYYQGFGGGRRRLPTENETRQLAAL
ncbi:MAG: radical SAM protein [Elusimicrobiota bacterium]